MENENTIAPHTGGIRCVDAGRGVEWLVGGFKIVFKTPGFWIVAGLVLMLVTLVANYVPVLGAGLATAVFVIASGAAMRACEALDAGRDPLPEAQQVLSHPPLLILGAIAGGLSMLIALVFTALVAASLGAALVVGSTVGAAAGMGMGLGMVMLNSLLMMLVYIALFIALWLAPALVVFKNMAPLDAMKTSIKATMKNPIAYIVLSVLTCVAYMIGLLPMMLGLLVVIPAAICATYLAYRDLFA